MKAIILIALVASVAARSLDLDTLRLVKEKSLLNNRPVLDDVLLKEKLIQQQHQLPLEKKTILGDIEKVNPLEEQIWKHQQGGIRGIYDDVDTYDRVFTFSELYNTQLFQEYLRIPLFRQYLQYPSFQRYVASVYFQKFWQVPTFRQYFWNPVLFYKYIYPQVQLFHTEYNYPTTYGQDIYNNYETQDVYQGLEGLVDDVYTRNKHVLPYVYNRYVPNYYNNRFAGQYLPQTYGTTTNYKFLLDKIYKNLYNQHVLGDVTQVKTDVKILPGEKKLVVEPITGERKVVEEPKIVDVKVAERTVPVEKVVDTVLDEVVPFEKTIDEVDAVITEHDVLLLKLLLKEHVITPEVYEAVIRGHVQIHHVLRRVFGQTIDAVDREVLLRKVLLRVLYKENVITHEIYQAVIRGQTDLHTVLRQIYGQTVELKDVVNQLVHHQRDVTDNIYNIPTVSRFDRYDILNKLVNKYDKYNTYYNTEIPTFRDNVYNRLPIQKVLENIVA